MMYSFRTAFMASVSAATRGTSNAISRSRDSISCMASLAGAIGSSRLLIVWSSFRLTYCLNVFLSRVRGIFSCGGSNVGAQSLRVLGKVGLDEDAKGFSEEIRATRILALV